MSKKSEEQKKLDRIKLDDILKEIKDKPADEIISQLPEQKQKYVIARAQGKNKYQSARQAGYTHNTARIPHQIESPDVKAVFQEIMRKRVKMRKVANRVAEGMDATQVKTATLGGRITDMREVPDFKERREYTALGAQLAGYWNPKQEIETTAKLDPEMARKLVDLTQRFNIADLDFEQRKELRKSYVPLQLEANNETPENSE